MSGEGFPEQVVPGGILIFPQVQSPNYVPGVSGWAIFRDGSAEFNNITIRGTFKGTDFIINSLGEFFYNGTPGGGNLTESIASASGSNDGEGNPFKDGFNVYDGNANIQLHVNGTVGAPAIELITGDASEAEHGAFYTVVEGSSPSQIIEEWIQGPGSTSDNKRTAILQISSAANGSSVANGQIIYFSPTQETVAFWDATGFHIPAGSIIATHPGAATAVPETWTTLSLNTGWSAGANNGFTDVPQVRLLADNKMLMFKGTLVTPATGTVTGVAFAALPAAYPNANFGGPFGRGVVNNLGGGQTGQVLVQNNGNLSLGGNFLNSTSIALNCIVPTQ